MDEAFAEARRAGVTCVVTGPGSANAIGGQMVALKTRGTIADQMTLRAPANMRWTETPLRCTLCVPISYGLWCLPRQASRCWRCILFEARRRARRSI